MKRELTTPRYYVVFFFEGALCRWLAYIYSVILNLNFMDWYCSRLSVNDVCGCSYMVFYSPEEAIGDNWWFQIGIWTTITSDWHDAAASDLHILDVSECRSPGSTFVIYIAKRGCMHYESYLDYISRRETSLVVYLPSFFFSSYKSIFSSFFLNGIHFL